MKTTLLLFLAALAASAQVKYEDILAGPNANWLTYAGSYSGQRHSALTQITPVTAKNLVPKWTYHVPDAKKLEAVPIVYDGILYVTNSNQLHALDARTGRKIWVYRDEQAVGSRVNRGPAILGANLYSDSLIAVNVDTGKLKWHFQFTPHDTHDWDAQSWPVLIDMPWQGKPRQIVVHPNRNGFFYVLDRVTGEFLRASPFVDKLDWAKGIDPQGKPILVPGKDPTPGGTRACPSVRGAANWMSPSYNAATGLFYLPTLEQCDIYSSSVKEPKPMIGFAGTGGEQIPAEPGQLLLRAIDPQTGKRVWEYPMPGPASAWAGTVSTAGGVLFFGDDTGHLVAADAKSGKHLWHFGTSQNITASPITYTVDGKQYVTICSATHVFTFGLFTPAE